MKRRPFLMFVLLVMLLWGRTALYSVDQAEFAYVTRFGEPRAVRDGSTDAGLHLKAPWPIDTVRRLDRRVQALDLPAVESLTRDPIRGNVDKTISVDTFVTWRIPDAQAADRFVRTVGSPEQARKLMAPQINGRLASLISSLPITNLIGVVESREVNWTVGGAAVMPFAEEWIREDDRLIDARSERFRSQLLAGFQTRTLEEYGIEIVDLRVRRFNYPEAVRASIAERIRSERAGKIEEYDSQGMLRAQSIISRATTEARAVESEAEARKARMIGMAAAQADQIRNQAHARDRDFYTFLKKIEFYQKILGESRDLILLSTNHPLFDRLLTPPRNTETQPRVTQPSSPE